MQHLVHLASWLLGALYCVWLVKQVAAMLSGEEKPQRIREGGGPFLQASSSLPDDPKGNRTVVEDRLLKVAEAYKEQIFSKFSELAPGRVAQIDRAGLEGKTTEEVLSLLYMQGVAEALDAFGVAELLRTAEKGTALSA